MQQVSRESASQEPDEGSRRLGYQPVFPMDWKVSVAPKDGASRQGVSKASEMGFVCVSVAECVSVFVFVFVFVSSGVGVSEGVDVSGVVAAVVSVVGFVFCSSEQAQRPRLRSKRALRLCDF